MKKINGKSIFCIIAGVMFSSAALYSQQENNASTDPERGALLKKKLQDYRAGQATNDGQRKMMDNQRRNFAESLSEEDRAQLKKLYAENPEEFKKELHKRIMNAKNKQDEEDAQIKDLVKKYRDAQSDQQKEDTEKQLKDLVTKQFQKKMDFNGKRIEEAEKRLSELKRIYEERQRKSDEIISQRVKDLTKDQTLNW